MLSWDGWREVPGNGTTDVGVACVGFDGKWYLFAKGIDNKRIYVNTSVDFKTWSGWAEVPGNFKTDVALCGETFHKEPYGHQLYLFAKDIKTHRIYVNTMGVGNPGADGVKCRGTAPLTPL